MTLQAIVLVKWIWPLVLPVQILREISAITVAVLVLIALARLAGFL